METLLHLVGAANLCFVTSGSQDLFSETLICCSYKEEGKQTCSPEVCLGSGGWLSPVLFCSSVEKCDKEFASLDMTRIRVEIK